MDINFSAVKLLLTKMMTNSISGGSRIYKCGGGRAKDEVVGCGGEGACVFWGLFEVMPPPHKKFSSLDLKMVTLDAFWGLFFYSSSVWFKCKSVVSWVKSTAKPNYWDYKANITGGCVAYSYKIY